MNESIAAVVLAFSREETLGELLAALRGQTRKPDEIIVIYQGSSDAAFQRLAAQSDLTVLRQENRGSAGGFCRGIEESIARGHGWTWIFDDDAIPRRDALEEMATRPCFHRADTSFIGSRIVDTNGVTYMSPGGSDSQEWYGTVLEDRCVTAVDACWLGLMVNSDAVRAAGLPIEEFFLWDEDREFVSRLVRHGQGYCALASVIVHHQGNRLDWFGKDFIKIAYYARNHVARGKLGEGSPARKAARVMKNAAHFLGRIARREIPLRVLPWICKGIFTFRPRVRYLPGSAGAARGRKG
jgi:GT2 family glycosyltransferase